MEQNLKNIDYQKFHGKHVYDKKYIKAKVKEFNGVVNTGFLGSEVPHERVHYTCMAGISVGSVMKIEKKELSTSLFSRVQA